MHGNKFSCLLLFISLHVLTIIKIIHFWFKKYSVLLLLLTIGDEENEIHPEMCRLSKSNLTGSCPSWISFKNSIYVFYIMQNLFLPF